MKECVILGGQTFSDSPTYFQGVKTPTPGIYAHGGRYFFKCTYIDFPGYVYFYRKLFQNT